MVIKDSKHADRLIFMLEGMIENCIDDENEDCATVEDCRGAISLINTTIPRGTTAVTTIVPSFMESEMLRTAQEQVEEYYGR